MNSERLFEMLQQQIERLQTDVTELHKKLDAKTPAPLPDALPELLTRKQACKLLGITLPTLTGYYQSGVIPAHRIGNNIRLKKFEIYQALQHITPVPPYKK